MTQKTKILFQSTTSVWKTLKIQNSSKGQLILEALWLVLFSCAFLAMLSHLYEKGQKEIQLSRIGGKNTYFLQNKKLGKR